MNQYLFALLFFLPAGIANATPPIANKIPYINKWTTPMDFGKKFRGQRIFGPHKSWRGLLTGMVAGGIVALIIYAFFIRSLYMPSILVKQNFILGSLLGFGALFGDAIESFFKRQIGIKSGESWLFFDQIDYVVGAILISMPIVRFSLDQYAFVILIYFVMHFIVSYLGFLLGFKDKPI